MARRRAAAGPRPRLAAPDRSHAARRGGFYSHIGFRIEGSEPRAGRLTVVGRVEPRHLNLGQVVHGGVYATILDTAMGGAVVSILETGETTATASLYVEFLKAARLGDVLRARGQVLRRGRHLAFVAGQLVDQAGRRLGQAHGTWYIWSPESRPPRRRGPRTGRSTSRAGEPAARRARGARVPS